jgi:hypothetical protein
MNGRLSRFALFAAVFAAFVALPAVAGTVEVIRNGGVSLDVPEGWARVDRASTAIADPRTLLVVGTKGARAVPTECQVATYRVPIDGAVVVVIGWRESFGGTSSLPLSGLKLRRNIFECFTGRGAVAQITRGGHDFQVNVMVGDKADAGVVADALDVARSFALVQK